MLTMKQEDFQRQFFRNAGPNIEILRQMADSMADVLFNIVDGENRVVAFNKANCANCNFRDESEIVGRRIEDSFPAVLADAYMSLYAEVRETGVPVRDRLCAHGADRSTELRVANVFPVRNGKGKIIGTATFYRPVSNGDITPEWYGSLKKAIAYIDAHYKEKIPLSTLAATAGMGTSTFRRVFTKLLSISPGEYISTIRINHARKLLAKTSLTCRADCGRVRFLRPEPHDKAFQVIAPHNPGRIQSQAQDAGELGSRAQPFTPRNGSRQVAAAIPPKEEHLRPEHWVGGHVTHSSAMGTFGASSPKPPPFSGCSERPYVRIHFFTPFVWLQNLSHLPPSAITANPTARTTMPVESRARVQQDVPFHSPRMIPRSAEKNTALDISTAKET